MEIMLLPAFEPNVFPDGATVPNQNENPLPSSPVVSLTYISYSAVIRLELPIVPAGKLYSTPPRFPIDPLGVNSIYPKPANEAVPVKVAPVGGSKAPE